MKDEELFDKQINQKFAEASIPTPNGAWETFAHSKAMQSHLKNQPFDEAIRQNLQQMPIPMAGNEWAAFKNHWSAHIHQNETDFDHAVRHKVNQANPQPGSESNAILQSAIQRSIIYKRQIWTGKLVELSMLLIILIAVFHIIPDFSNLKPKLQLKNPTELPALSPTDNQYDRADATNSLNNDTYGGKSAFVDKPLINNGTKEYQETLTIPTDRNNEYKPTNNTSTAFAASNNKPVRDDVILPANNLVVTVINADPIPTAFENEFSAHTSNGFPAMSSNNSPTMMHALHTIPEAISLPQSYVQSLYQGNQPLIAPVVFKIGQGKKIISEWWIGVKIGQAYNLIKTPVSNIQTRSYQYQNINSSIAGFNMEMKSDFVNIETGIYYSFKQFGQGNYDKDRGHFVNIPLSLKKDFFAKKKLSPYIKAGPDFTILAKAAYDPDLDNPSFQNLPAALAPSKEFAHATVEDGVIHSGNLNRNSFFGIHGGVGVEYKFSNSNKLTLELMHQLNPFDKGLGINNHKFTETAINVGYKHILYYN